jgi:general secretion pathway protein G
MLVRNQRRPSCVGISLCAAILLLLVGFTGCVCPRCFLGSLDSRITAVDSTTSAMGETFVRIDLYAKAHGTIPASLDVLPNRDGYTNRTTDGWGRPLIYSIGNDGLLTLTSYGKDGKPGGEGADADIVKSYYSKRADGSLWVGSEMWLVEAEVR